MKIKKRTNTTERHIIIGMIVDDIVLGHVQSKWQGNMFKSKWANIVAGWCIKFYIKYKKAPMKSIENMYAAWGTKNKDEDMIDMLGTFLSSLSEDYEALKEESNTDYLLDITGKYFNKVKAEQTIEAVQGHIDEDEVEQAIGMFTNYNRVEIGMGEGIDVFQDDDAIRKAFEEKQEPLVVYPGALGRFFKHALERDAFVSFMGPEKRGKSFWLQDLAYRAVLQRRKVAFFEAGDMSQNQIMRRLMVRTAKRPLYPAVIKYPVKIKKRKKKKGKSWEVGFDERVYKEPLSWQRARKACRKLIKSRIRSRKPYFRLSCHANSTLSVQGIRSILQNWEREDWVPDVIIVDYADILDMKQYGLEGRDQINDVWKQLRALSQTYHCLVATATQADAASYDTNTIGKKHFSEDKRKYAHVTGMIGLNASKEDKEEGVMRLNWIVLREGEFSESKCICVAGCLNLANPSICSSF